MNFLLILNYLLLGINSEVLELTDDTIQGAIDTYDSIMIDFYASWCSHCQKLAPIYEDASLILEESGSDAVLAKIDCDIYENVGKQWKISKYPTLLYFKNGSLVEKYTGKRNAEEIADYMLSNTN